MTLSEELGRKVEQALGELRVLDDYRRPVVLSSFGKDSMVMLDLVEHAGFDLPILSFREPFFPKKYAFANSVVEDRGYTVYDYPPVDTQLALHNGTAEIINYYATSTLPLYLPTGIKEPEEGEDFLCGLVDLYGKPKVSAYEFPWDVLLVGHKSTDVDPILGVTPLKRFHEPSTPAVVLPLKEFTDEDVWAYTVARGLPINRRRYDEANGWREFKNVTHNPDYFPTCVACMVPGEARMVACPKTGAWVHNVSDRVKHAGTLVLPPYVDGGEQLEESNG